MLTGPLTSLHGDNNLCVTRCSALELQISLVQYITVIVRSKTKTSNCESGAAHGRSTEVVVTVVVDFVAEIECKWRVRGIKTVLFAGVTGHHLFPVCRDVISPCFGGS